MSDRLGVLLRVRRMQRDVARAARVAAMSGQAQAGHAVDAALGRLDDAAVSRRHPASAPSADQLRADHQVLTWRASVVTIAEHRLRDAEHAAAASLADLVRSDQRVSAVEQWDQRRRAERAVATLKTEQREADDLAGARPRARTTTRGTSR